MEFCLKAYNLDIPSKSEIFKNRPPLKEQFIKDAIVRDCWNWNEIWEKRFAS